jgi:hypothetical protein
MYTEVERYDELVTRLVSGLWLHVTFCYDRPSMEMRVDALCVSTADGSLVCPIHDYNEIDEAVKAHIRRYSEKMEDMYVQGRFA